MSSHPVATREAYVALFSSLSDAVAFEEGVLAAVGDEHPEIGSPRYWQWLADQQLAVQ
jgi:hypothetical protein